MHSARTPRWAKWRRVLAGHRRRFRHGQPAAPNAEIDGCVEFRIIELHQHIAADDTELCGAEGAECGHVETADLHQRELRMIGAEAELSRILVDESSFRDDIRALEERQSLLKNASLRQGHHERGGPVPRHPPSLVFDASGSTS